MAERERERERRVVETDARMDVERRGTKFSCENYVGTGKINLYPRGGGPPLTDSRIVRPSLSWSARMVKNGDGALRPRQFSLHYGEHQSCAAFAGR